MTKGWIDIGSVDEVPERGSRVVGSPSGNIAIFKTAEGVIFALGDRCPHKGGPLSQGIVHDRFVTCPLHNWVIDLATGSALAPDRGCVKTFPVRVEAGRIIVDAAELALDIAI